jgi:hypothetical protein
MKFSLVYNKTAPTLKMIMYTVDRLWSSGQSSWLQIWRHGFDSRHYEKKK